MEKEKTGLNEDRKECEITNISKRKADVDDLAYKNERKSDNIPDKKQVCRTNSAQMESTQLFVSDMSTLAVKFIYFTGMSRSSNL